MHSDPIRRRMREVHAAWSPQERLARAEEGRRRIRQLLKLIGPAKFTPATLNARTACVTAK